MRTAGGVPHHLYWETEDGSNTYPVRLRRYETFRRLARRLGIDAYKGVDGELKTEMKRSLDDFRRHARAANPRRTHRAAPSRSGRRGKAAV